MCVWSQNAPEIMLNSWNEDLAIWGDLSYPWVCLAQPPAQKHLPTPLILVPIRDMLFVVYTLAVWYCSIPDQSRIDLQSLVIFKEGAC